MGSVAPIRDEMWGAQGKEAYVKEMFARISRRYDLLNRVLSFRQDIGWRRFAVRQSEVKPGDRVLDVATGTGDLAFELAHSVGPTGEVVGVDFCEPMLDIAQQKAKTLSGGAICKFLEGDAMALPFEDNQFDAAVTGFAMRNVNDVSRAFSEMRRVVRPGGRVVCLELSRPVVPFFREAYTFYFQRLVPLIGRFGLGGRGPYDYLPKSVLRFPNQDGLAEIMRQSGLSKVRYFNLTGGIVAVHVGEVEA